MAVVKVKKINGKDYLYAEHSFRLPDNKIKKISKFINKNSDLTSDEVKKYFIDKEKEWYGKYAIINYKRNHIFTEARLIKLENMRVGYKYLLNKLTKEQIKGIIDRFTINSTYESNAIEGNSLTLKDVTMVLLENYVPNGKDLREIYETRNTRKAHDLIFSKKITITPGNILKIHSIIVKDTGVLEGYKKLPNYLMMRNVKTALPEKVEQEISTLCDWLSESKEHPIVKAVEFHARFERIHPFDDGNGRVGRILLNIILINEGFPPIIIRKTMRSSYFGALEAYDNGHKDKFIRFIIEKMNKTYQNFFEEYIKYL